MIKAHYLGSENLTELRNKLQSQILLFQALRRVFVQENAKSAWQIPINFNQHQVDAFLQNALRVLQFKDEASY